MQEAWSRFYDTDYLEQLAINTFYGFGYNFYRQEDQLRQDDQRVRARACSLLQNGKSVIEQANSEYRRKALPPPTRQNPTWDPAALAKAETFSALIQAFNALESEIRALPVPANDRMTQRYRQEAKSLQGLIEFDKKMLGQSSVLATGLEQHRDPDWIYDNERGIKEYLQAITSTIRGRQAYLL
jgi:hypothetical protein